MAGGSHRQQFVHQRRDHLPATSVQQHGSDRLINNSIDTAYQIELQLSPGDGFNILVPGERQKLMLHRAQRFC